MTVAMEAARLSSVDMLEKYAGTEHEREAVGIVLRRASDHLYHHIEPDAPCDDFAAVGPARRSARRTGGALMALMGIRAPSFLGSRKGRHADVIARKASRQRPLPGEVLRHAPGWVSANCINGRHGACYALKCECPHHTKEAR